MSARRVDSVLANESSLVRVTPPLPTQAQSAPVTTGTFTNGNDGDPIDNTVITGGSLRASKKGLFALEKADLFNLLVIPPYRTDGDIDAAVLTDAVAYATERRAMVIVDPPVGGGAGWSDLDKAVAGAATLTSSKNAALFFPRIREADPLRDRQIGTFAPCGAVAGVIRAHRRDARRVEGARRPRGDPARRRSSSAMPLTDVENGALNPLGVNCLRNLPGARARVVWGARTLAGADRLASEWKYVPVRRTALFIEETLYRGTQWVVFEPNDEPLWAQIRLNVGAFMHDLFRQGAFQGTTPREAYFVKCDSETTTQNDINLGIVNIVVGFAPLKPAEFVVIKLQQMAGQIAGVRSDDAMAQFTVNAAALRPVQELQVPREVGRPLRRRHQQGRRAQAHDRGGRAPRGRRPVSTSRKSPGRTEVRGDHARARRHARHRVRAVGQQGLELRLRASARRSRSRTSART